MHGENDYKLPNRTTAEMSKQKKHYTVSKGKGGRSDSAPTKKKLRRISTAITLNKRHKDYFYLWLLLFTAFCLSMAFVFKN